MTQCIAFHSYKGGTGKTTIACNLAALLTSKGYKVGLLDLDVYAPSLYSYFAITPKKWINDILSESAKTEDVLVDMTPVIERLASASKNSGKLWVGFSNPQKEEVYKLEGSGQHAQPSIRPLRKFIQLRDIMVSDFECDYILIDTSPGIRFWSINSLALADTIFLTLKFGELDISGTRKLASDIYDSLKKFGAKTYLLLNRVDGYCVPNTLILPNASNKSDQTVTLPLIEEADFGRTLSRDVSMDLISSIPCYCDIQFNRKEFLTVLQNPNHPFARQLDRLVVAGHFVD